LRPAFANTANAGYLRLDEDAVALTPAGQAEIDRLAAAWRDWLDGRLEDWTCADPDDRARLDRAMDSIASRLLEEEESRLEQPVAA
jgi:hypothetical protein